MNSDAILTLARRRYAAHRALTLATVSTYVTGSGDPFTRLEQGRTITLRRAEVLLKKFSERWQQELEWPAEIPRPQRAAAVLEGPGGRGMHTAEAHGSWLVFRSTRRESRPLPKHSP